MDKVCGESDCSELANCKECGLYLSDVGEAQITSFLQWEKEEQEGKS